MELTIDSCQECHSLGKRMLIVGHTANHPTVTDLLHMSILSCVRQTFTILKLNDKDVNKHKFDEIHHNKSEIEGALGELSWERLNDKRAVVLQHTLT
jgi:hypothetical protein